MSLPQIRAGRGVGVPGKTVHGLPVLDRVGPTSRSVVSVPNGAESSVVKFQRFLAKVKDVEGLHVGLGNRLLTHGQLAHALGSSQHQQIRFSPQIDIIQQLNGQLGNTISKAEVSIDRFFQEIWGEILSGLPFLYSIACYVPEITALIMSLSLGLIGGGLFAAVIPPPAGDDLPIDLSEHSPEFYARAEPLVRAAAMAQTPKEFRRALLNIEYDLESDLIQHSGSQATQYILSLLRTREAEFRRAHVERLDEVVSELEQRIDSAEVMWDTSVWFADQLIILQEYGRDLALLRRNSEAWLHSSAEDEVYAGRFTQVLHALSNALVQWLDVFREHYSADVEGVKRAYCRMVGDVLERGADPKVVGQRVNKWFERILPELKKEEERLSAFSKVLYDSGVIDESMHSEIKQERHDVKGFYRSLGQFVQVGMFLADDAGFVRGNLEVVLRMFQPPPENVRHFFQWLNERVAEIAEREGVEIVFRVPSSHRFLFDSDDGRIDAGKMARLFENILSNAIRYSRSEAERAGDSSEHAKVVTLMFYPDKGVVLIHDQGVGMRRNFVEDFGHGQAREGRVQVEGSEGIGSTSIKTLAEEMGLQYRIVSVEDKGTMFVVQFFRGDIGPIAGNEVTALPERSASVAALDSAQVSPEPVSPEKAYPELWQALEKIARIVNYSTLGTFLREHSVTIDHPVFEAFLWSLANRGLESSFLTLLLFIGHERLINYGRSVGVEIPHSNEILTNDRNLCKALDAFTFALRSERFFTRTDDDTTIMWKFLEHILEHSDDPILKIYVMELVLRSTKYLRSRRMTFNIKDEVFARIVELAKHSDNPYIRHQLWKHLNMRDISFEDLTGSSTFESPEFGLPVYRRSKGLDRLVYISLTGILGLQTTSASLLDMSDMRPIHSLADYNPDTDMRRPIIQKKLGILRDVVQDVDLETLAAERDKYRGYFFRRATTNEDIIVVYVREERFVVQGHHRLATLKYAVDQGIVPQNWMKDIPVFFVGSDQLPGSFVYYALSHNNPLSWDDLFPQESAAIDQ